jgi:hypothetical protein
LNDLTDQEGGYLLGFTSGSDDGMLKLIIGYEF